ncbi:MAG: hypothetical protein ACRDKJ_01375 [Actinomycetota bacterium]
MRFVVAAAFALGLVAAPVGAFGRADPVEIRVDRVVGTGDVRPASIEAPDPGVRSVIPDVVRHVIDGLPGRKPSIQDHDDIEDTDRPDVDVDVPEEDDGRVINGEFEGGSVEQGHNVTSTRPSPKP